MIIIVFDTCRICVCAGSVLCACVRRRTCARACVRNNITSDALQRLPTTALPTPHPITGNQTRPSKDTGGTVTFLLSAYPGPRCYTTVIGNY